MTFFALTTYAVFCVLGAFITGFCFRKLRHGPFIVGSGNATFGFAYGALFNILIMLAIIDPDKRLFPFGAGVAWFYLILPFVAPRRGGASATIVGLSENSFRAVFDAAVKDLNLSYEIRPSLLWITYVVDPDSTKLTASFYGFFAQGGVYAQGPNSEPLVGRIVEAMSARVRESQERVSRAAYLYLTCGAILSVVLGVKFALGLADLRG